MNATVALKGSQGITTPLGSPDSSSGKRLTVAGRGVALPALPRIPSRKFFRQ